MMAKIATLRTGFARGLASIRQTLARAWSEFRRILGEGRRAVLDRWRALTGTQREFVKNLGIGFGILFVVAFVSQANAFVELKRATLDWQIAMLSGTDTGSDVAFVDIDQFSANAYQADSGGAFYFTPRDKIMQLIDIALAAKPKAVVVDFDLSQPADDPFVDAFREVYGRLPTADERKRGSLVVPKNARLDPVQQFFVNDWRLSDYLASYARTCAARPEFPLKGSCVPIVLARTTLQTPQPAGRPPIRTQAPSFLDDALGGPDREPSATGSRAVLWGSTTFDQDDDDVVRHWRLWEPACTALGKPDVLTSSALLAANFVKGWMPTNDLHSALVRHFAPDNCRSTFPTSMRETGDLTVGPILLSQEALARTERFSIGWTQASTSLANQFSAQGLSDASERADIACHGNGLPCASGKVVVIGSSYLDNGDIHRTPTIAGEMPGSVILVNEINSLLQPQPTLRENLILTYAIEGVLIVLLSWFLIFFDPTLVSMIATTVTLLVLIVLSFVFLGAGVWVDVSLPLVGIQMHEWFSRAEHAWHRRKGTKA
jgi:CHASE2 domain-containing sensor protein